MKPLHSLAWGLGTIFVAAFVAWLVAKQTRPTDHSHGDSSDNLHEWLHGNLAITPEQETLLRPIELAFDADSERCRSEIREAGAALAEAIRNYPENSAEITTALARLHEAKNRLGKITLDHFFAMKKHLSPEQGENLLKWTHDSIIHEHGH